MGRVLATKGTDLDHQVTSLARKLPDWVKTAFGAALGLYAMVSRVWWPIRGAATVGGVLCVAGVVRDLRRRTTRSRNVP
jgi:hypothetical protein